MCRLVVLVLLAFCTAAGTACVDADREMEASDAREFTLAALEDAGLADVEIDRRVEAGVFRPQSSGTPVAVWETHASVDGGNVTLFVTRRGNRAVYLNDVSDDGGALLDDDQFERLDRFRMNPAADRQRDRLIVPGVLAAALALGAGAWLMFAAESGRVPSPLEAKRVRI